MAATATRLTAPDFARLIHRHGLSADDVRAQNIIVPKAYVADSVVCEVKSEHEDEDEKRTSTWIISTATPDRRGDTIQVRGWKLTNFRKGGSILFAHNGFALPVAKPTKVWKDGGTSLNLAMLHTNEDQNPLGAQVFALVKGGFLRGNSVGFLPIKWEFIDDEEPWNGGINFLQQELVEDSIVPVPQNPEALLQAVGKGLDCDLKLFTGWQRQALDGEVPSLGAYSEDIAASLKALTGNPVSVSVPETEKAAAPKATGTKSITVTLPIPYELSAQGAEIAEAADLARTAFGALEQKFLAFAADSPNMSASLKARFEELVAPTAAARQALAVLGLSPESSGGAVSGPAASQPPAGSAAPSVDKDATPAPNDGWGRVGLTVEQAVAVVQQLSDRPEDDDPAGIRRDIMDAIKTLVAPPATQEGDPVLTAEQVKDHIDALLKSAQDGDTDALEQLRTLATQVDGAAKALAEVDPDDMFVMELTDDPAAGSADEGADVIEISEAEFKAAVAKQVAQTMLAQTGRI